MALFDRFKKKNTHSLNAPVSGKAVPVSEVNDPTFAQDILGKGIAVIPDSDQVCAPAAGTISTVFHTMHAVAMTTDFGAEVLIHIGLDTVNLEGKYFEAQVKEGDQVKAGDPLVKFDRVQIAAAGYDTITPMVVCNPDNFKSVTASAAGTVGISDAVMELE